ncbi:MAG: hypothetical protein JWN30_655 [Bacilli bacterium]|nr:hypothetical protein [Bacilli bacterium]
MKINKKVSIIISSLLVSSGLVACAGKGSSQGAAANATDDIVNQPTTLVVWSGSGDPEQNFNDKYGDAIRKKFPNYTIKYISSKGGNSLQSLLGSGTNIDIYYDSIGLFPQDVQQSGFQYDMTSLLNKYKIDLSVIEPTSMNAMKQMANGAIWGLPVWVDEMVMYYNKDIFDKFGVQYPKDGMTWDDVLNLSKQLTKTDNGKQYFGLSVSTAHMLRLNQLSLSYVDQKSNLPTINTDQAWKQLYQTVFMDPSQNAGYIQGIKTLGDKLPYTDQFVKDKDLAMFVVITALSSGASNDTMKDVNWDMVSMPTLPGKPGIGSQAYPTYFGITSNSTIKDQATEVIKYLTSEEFQEKEAKLGMVPVLNNPTIRSELGQDSAFKGKHFSSLLYNKFAPISYKSRFDSAVEKTYSSIIPQLAEGTVDINTAFRDTEQQANKAIETAKQSQ